MNRAPIALWCLLLAMGWTAVGAAQEAPANAPASAPANAPANAPGSAPAPDSAPEPAFDAEAVQQRFDRATGLMAAGDFRQAAALLIALADDAPDSELADDALFSAAKLHEEKLAEPLRASELYRRLQRDYPDSRTALAARRRAQAIDQAIGTDGQGAQALARFTDILQHFSERGERESLAMADQLLREHADWSGRTAMLSWIAAVHHRNGRFAEALSWYRRAAEVAPESENAREALVEAYRGAGDAALALGHFDTAEELFRQMPVADDQSLQRSLDDALERVERGRLRAALYQLSFAVLIAIALVFLALWRSACGSFRHVVRDAWRPPQEAIFMLPIAGLLMAASLTAHYAIAPAVAIICIGGLAVTWLSGGGLRAARARPQGSGRWRPLAHASASASAVLALTYIALHHNRLLDMIIQTVRFGPDV